MTAHLYWNASDRNVVNKKINNVGSNMTVHFKDESDVINPTIYLSRTVNINNANYIYISSPFNRYYFIESVTVENQRYVVQCHVDVLYTYRSTIERQKAIIKRNARHYNMYLDDDVFQLDSRKRIWTKYFNGGFLSNGNHGNKIAENIIVLNGGGANQ